MHLFLSGAEMQPERVRVAWPEARFVARGRLQPPPVGDLTSPASVLDETWGIVIETPEAPAAGAARVAVADDSRTFAVIVPVPDAADPAAVLAAARYWELPPAYARRLARAANAPVEEYTY